MALHGLIEVNGTVIGSWDAQRVTNTGETPAANDVNVYRCVVSRLHGATQRFEVEHRYGDGAVALAAKVLGRAARPERAADPGTCPVCRHAAHGEWCPNMASDNDCSCTHVTRPDSRRASAD